MVARRCEEGDFLQDGRGKSRLAPARELLDKGLNPPRVRKSATRTLLQNDIGFVLGSYLEPANRSGSIFFTNVSSMSQSLL